MSVKAREGKWQVRYRDESGRNRGRTFDRKGDADQFDAEQTRRRQLGELHTLEPSGETLNQYVTDVWLPLYVGALATSTQDLYAGLYDRHIGPVLGELPLRAIKPETVARWQQSRVTDVAGLEAIRKAHTLLGSILERAYESDRVASNAARKVRKVKAQPKKEVRPLAPRTIEAMRAGSSDRDRALLSVLAYAGPRPGEAFALRWGKVRDRTLVVDRSLWDGVEKDTKTGRSRAVRLLDPLAEDLAEWRRLTDDASDDALIFPDTHGNPVTLAGYQSWRRRGFRRALDAAGVDRSHPYALRHSFASLLLHEGRSPIYVARQLGNSLEMVGRTYGHVIEELDDRPQLPAEDAIREARGPVVRAEYADPAIAADVADPTGASFRTSKQAGE